MHDTTRRSQCLRLGLAPGTPSPQLSALLALQRAQEPETALVLSEVSDKELASGLGEGRYHAGLSLLKTPTSWVNSQPLWYENMAAALPPQSPLLGRATLTVTDLIDLPVSRWRAEVCPQLEHQWSALQSRSRRDIELATSFQMLAVWVATGHGIGVSAQSRIERARAWEIIMRPLVGGPYEITTHLLKPSDVQPEPTLTRFERRAQIISSHWDDSTPSRLPACPVAHHKLLSGQNWYTDRSN